MLQGGAPDPRDDVYSLGCIIYTMLSGVHPFGSRSAVEARDLALAMTPLQILSGDQNAALAQALSFQQAQRTPSVTALLAGLGWTADPPAAASLAHAPAAIPASAAATAESTPPAAAASEQPIAPRPARRVPVRLPIPSISAIPPERPKLPKPPKTPKSPAPPAPGESRRIVMPALIVLSLSLLVVGIGIYVHRKKGASVTAQSHTAISPPAAASPMAPSPATAVSPGATASPPLAGAVASPQKANQPSVAGAKTVPVAPIPVLRPLPKAAAAMADSDNCPYPREAVAQGLTGTVFLLVYVASDGRAMQIKMDKTSGSDVLDQAAVRCIEQYGRFAAPEGKSSSGGYWGRIRFKWSFGA
jgi:TonB family protein